MGDDIRGEGDYYVYWGSDLINDVHVLCMADGAFRWENIDDIPNFSTFPKGFAEGYCQKRVQDLKSQRKCVRVVDKDELKRLMIQHFLKNP